VGGEIFRTCPDRPWGPPSLLCNGYRVFPGGKERPGRDADPSPPSSAVGYERVELYIYSPYGPYGLYRASLPVQGCTLPLPLPGDCFVVLVSVLFNPLRKALHSNRSIPFPYSQIVGLVQCLLYVYTWLCLGIGMQGGVTV